MPIERTPSASDWLCDANTSTCLSFATIAEGKLVFESWRRHYNTGRPHSS